MSQLRPDYCLLILSMCIITFITFQYVIIRKSSVFKCKDLKSQRMHCWGTTWKKSFLSTFVFVTVIEDYPKFSQISCPAPKLVPNHHNWQWGARPSRVLAFTQNGILEIMMITNLSWIKFSKFHVMFCAVMPLYSISQGVSRALMIFISINPGSLRVANHNKPPRDKSITPGDTRWQIREMAGP